MVRIQMMGGPAKELLRAPSYKGGLKYHKIYLRKNCTDSSQNTYGMCIWKKLFTPKELSSLVRLMFH